MRKLDHRKSKRSCKMQRWSCYPAVALGNFYHRKKADQNYIQSLRPASRYPGHPHLGHCPPHQHRILYFQNYWKYNSIISAITLLKGTMSSGYIYKLGARKYKLKSCSSIDNHICPCLFLNLSTLASWLPSLHCLTSLKSCCSFLPLTACLLTQLQTAASSAGPAHLCLGP